MIATAENATLAVDSVSLIPVWLEISAMCVSGLFGGVIAGKRGAPILAILIGGLIVGLGGGIIRDLLLNVIPVAISTWYLLPAVGGAALIGGAFNRFF